MKVYVTQDNEQLNEEDWERVDLNDDLKTLREGIDLMEIVKDRTILESMGVRIFLLLAADGSRKNYCVYLKKETKNAL